MVYESRCAPVASRPAVSRRSVPAPSKPLVSPRLLAREAAALPDPTDAQRQAADKDPSTSAPVEDNNEASRSTRGERKAGNDNEQDQGDSQKPAPAKKPKKKPASRTAAENDDLKEATRLLLQMTAEERAQHLDLMRDTVADRATKKKAA